MIIVNVPINVLLIDLEFSIFHRYIPPLRPVTSRWSLELPDSPSAIEEELRKQESVVSQIHEQLLKGKDPQKEDALWEVQRVCTQLKRKVSKRSMVFRKFNVMANLKFNLSSNHFLVFDLYGDFKTLCRKNVPIYLIFGKRRVNRFVDIFYVIFKTYINCKLENKCKLLL